jgi:hypothetical protein
VGRAGGLSSSWTSSDFLSGHVIERTPILKSDINREEDGFVGGKQGRWRKWQGMQDA